MDGLENPPIDPLRLLLFKKRILQEETEGTEELRALPASILLIK